MSEMQLKKMLNFSKNYIPPGWRPFLVGDFASLSYIGRENLAAMLCDWKLTLHASGALVDCLSKTNDKTESARSWLEYHATLCERAKKAIPHFEKIIKDAESKPVFCKHRPLNYFNRGDRVFTCIEYSDGSVSDYTKGTVSGVSSNSATVKLDEYQDISGEITTRSPFILSEKDAEYLTGDANYLLMYSKMCGFKGGGEITYFEDLVVECGIKYFSDNCLYDDGQSPDIFFPVFGE